jgi:hypothetical protein
LKLTIHLTGLRLKLSDEPLDLKPGGSFEGPLPFSLSAECSTCKVELEATPEQLEALDILTSEAKR